MKVFTSHRGSDRSKCLATKFTRHGQKYTAMYLPDGGLFELTNDTKGVVVPRDTQTFRRLADHNRGGKFQPVS